VLAAITSTSVGLAEEVLIGRGARMVASGSDACSDPIAASTRRHRNVGQEPVGNHGSAGFLASHDHANCKAELALRVIQGRWKLLILRELIEGVRRFSDLQRGLSGVSQKVLTAQLRELEADGVVRRTVYPEVPPRVDYALTDLGRELIPVLEGLHAWGEKKEAGN
jgi:DNA-binding HxlR family transcriptional regulator